MADASEPRWTVEPAAWHREGDVLVATARARSDFWRITHYGFVRHDGHALGHPVRGDFEAVVRFSGDYRTRYDQAGLLLCVDEERWLKAGVEYVDGIAWLSAVVTDGRSDWSLASPLDPAAPTWLRLSRRGEDVTVEHAEDGSAWRLVRLASLPSGDADVVGPMLACPDGDAFTARFEHFALRRID